ncbi:MAG: 50S ribosomal protein L19 [Cytophagales bacterium]|nr:50S ribosomal protein L19 [Marinoscillum sp.]MAK06723.1 50S ribosomal protein L19 [Marinoscillum sp.]OUX27014.1 MAG: 50S ribosomal protein L19 [Flammeovirgaceae bacterium TMED262]PDH44055.1 MAG: 50S ribosomal protein L19 [Rhodothermaeota bacterium MED-G18]|tara:strand:- start:769 stop:1122 length:354 start_codon:yes stop_codon:yes gene_type:complete
MASIDFKLTKENSETLKSFPDFGSGDTINVHIKIREGNKERIQQFQGTVLQRKNIGTNGETFTIRKISDSIAVEKIIPILSPSIDKIDLVRKGKVRRARIFYLRDRKGKSAKIKEKL